MALWIAGNVHSESDRLEMLNQFMQEPAQSRFIENRRADAPDDPPAVFNALAQVLDNLA